MGKCGGEEIYLTSCPICGAKYQVTKGGIIYQTAKRRENSKTERVSGRLSKQRKNEIVKKWGSVQAYLDNGKV